MTLAAQGFTSIFPIIIVLASLSSAGSGRVGSGFAARVGLSDEATKVLESSFPAGSTVRNSLTIVGLLVTVLSATSFSRALERTYAKVWSAPKANIKGAWRWLAVLLAIVVALFCLYYTRSALARVPGHSVLVFVTDLVLFAALWSLVPKLLLRGALAWRSAFFSGVLTAIVLAVVGLVSSGLLRFAMSDAIAYGALGVAFTYIAWLFAIFVAIILANLWAQAVLDGEGKIGIWVRGEGEQSGPTENGKPAHRASSDPDQSV